MGANKKKTARKKAATKKKPSPEVREITFTDEQEQLFGEAHATIVDLVDDMKNVGIPMREFAVALTKLEESEMWLQRGFEALGLDDDDEEDDDEEEADEEEE